MARVTYSEEAIGVQLRKRDTHWHVKGIVGEGQEEYHIQDCARCANQARFYRHPNQLRYQRRCRSEVGSLLLEEVHRAYSDHNVTRGGAHKPNLN